MLELTVRLIASLAVVVGLLLLLARFAGRRYAGRAGAPVQVVHRQQLSRSSAIAVVSVGSRLLVIGTTDQQVSLLTELDPEDLPEAAAMDDARDPDELVLLPASQVDPATVLEAAEEASDGLPHLPRRGGAHRAAPARPTAPVRPAQGPLAGSVLSPQTWRQALAAATGQSSGDHTTGRAS
ncbi:flagellar biosynthetic protein FliO [Nocardioides sp. GCM10027113]|uniref:flagellar biosynthetic protein FliO n=1 Tax=unclassified Nocardioides TaxID=2615069 RepID=UPI00361E8C68